MDKKGFIIITLLITIICMTIAFGETYALIIGVGNYEEDVVKNLSTAVQDAEKLAKMLIQKAIVAESNMTLLINPKYTDMLVEIEQWIGLGEEDDKMIFYYGGHSEQGKNQAGKTDIYLMPSDVRSENLERTSYNFRQEWQERLSQKLQAGETLMIFDTCYAGGITLERSHIKDLKIRSLEFEKIAEEKGVNFLLSSKENQTSKEMPRGQGGWFTYYLLEGLSTGEANYNNDLQIDIEEISRYLEERVSASTDGEQTPVSILGKKDMTIADDESRLYERIKNVIIEQYWMGAIQEAHSKIFINILNQQPREDSQTDAKIRQYLKRYYDDRDSEVLAVLTQNELSKQEIKPEQTPFNQTGKDLQRQTETPQQEEVQQSSQRQGTCYLKLTASNEKAKSASIYIDGHYEGTLETGTLLIERLSKETHVITIDGDKIEREEIQITFDNDWMMLPKAIEAQAAKRKLLIITDPSGAVVQVNGRTETEKTPVMIAVTIEENTTLTLAKEGFQTKTITVREESKGEPKRIETTLKENKAPNPPILIAPTGNEEETTVELQWYATDPEGDAIAYDIYLSETGSTLEKIATIEANTNEENHYRLTNLKANTKYTWRIDAKDRWKQTEGAVWIFKTREIMSQQIRIETEPADAKVYINERYVGNSPLTKELTEGTYEIKVEAEDYKEKKETITIGINTKNLSRTRTIRFELEKIQIYPRVSKYYDTKGNLKFYMVFTIHDEGKIQKKQTFSNEGELEDEVEYINIYENGILKGMKIESDNGQGIYKLNQKGQVVFSESDFGRGKETDYYEYQDDGRIQIIKTYDSENNLIRTSKYISLYRDNQLIERNSIIKYHDSDYNASTKNKFEYDSNGNIKKDDYFYNEEFISSTLFEYDEYGRQILYKSYDKDGNMTGYTISEYGNTK